MKNRNLYKIAIQGFGLTVCVLLFCSCFSFDIGDKPSKYVCPANNFGSEDVSIEYALTHESAAANWCGPIGAFFAYYLMYYLGPGVFVLLAAAAWAMALNLLGIKVTQILLRSAGLVLLVMAVSSSWYLVWPGRHLWPYGSGGFPMGNGGIFGIAMGTLLRAHFATLGTSIVVGSSWAVGAVLLADTAVLAFVRWVGVSIGRILALAVPAWSTARRQSRMISDIWKKLSAGQKKRSAETAISMHQSDMELAGIIEQQHHEYADYDNTEEGGREQVEKGPQGENADSANAPAVKPKRAKPYIPKSYEDYKFPPLELLKSAERGFAAVQEKMVEQKARSVEALLAEFGINANVVNAEPGPAITMYELELAPGVKVSQICNLANDMARALGAVSVRVVAPLAGRHTIGIEVPNSQREIVRIKELIQRAGARPEHMQIPLFLGKSSSGESLVSDLAAMPHMLIAGTTGSGKSVCINSIITSVLLTRRPDEVKLILVDPKMVEMTAFEMIPHLMCPIITDIKRAEQILEWAMTKMDERYELLSEARVRNIGSYNKLSTEEIIERFNPSTAEEEAKIPKRLPHIVIIVDELADLMMTAAKEIESYIVRLAQKSRAVGIHLVLATQRPQATVVTGLIKSNMPCRVGFRVASRMDSRIILDQNGAETLLGQGDMLFLKPGTSDLVRSQGAFVDDKEIKKVTQYLREVAQPQFHPELMQLNHVDMSMMAKDEMFDEAVMLVLETKRGSVSLLQRRLSVGYARAARMIEMMAASGILGEYKGSQAREVQMTLKEYEAAKKQMTIDAVEGFSDLTDEEEYEEPAEVDEEVETVDDEIAEDCEQIIQQ